MVRRNFYVVAISTGYAVVDFTSSRYAEFSRKRYARRAARRLNADIDGAGLYEWRS